MINKVFEIKTERLLLRPLELGDLVTAHEYASDIVNTEFMVYLPNDTIQETEQFLQRVVSEWNKDVPCFYEYAIILNEKHIGAVSVSLDETRQEGELGWIINKTYHGNGYATEAAKAIFDFSIKELKIKRIFANCDYRNEPSIKVMKKIGLSFESDDGIRRYKNSEEDVREIMYSLDLK